MALAEGYTVLAGGGQRRSGLQPYAPLLDTLCRSLRSLSAAQLRASVAGCGWLARLLPELVELANVPLPAGTIPPEQERRLVFAAVARYLANIAGSAGMLLLLDDLRWASPDGLDLLASLIQRADGTGARVIGAYRDTEVGQDHPLARLLAEQALIEQLFLAPLEEAAALALLGQLLPRDLEGQEVHAVRRRIVERAGGVPFFLVSCVHGLSLGDQGESVPWTVTQSIRQRVAALCPSAQEVLQAAAILGRVIRRSILVELVSLDEREVMLGLDEAGSAGLLLPEGRATYCFAHDVIREVIEATLDLGVCLLLHRKAAEALERLPERERSRRAAELAWHFQEGDEPARVLRYAVLAGDQTELLFAHRKAERHYRQTLELARTGFDPLCEAEAAEKLGRVLNAGGHRSEARVVLADALQAYRILGDLEGEARVATWITGLGETPAEGIARIQPLLERLETAGPSEVQARTWETMAYLLDLAGLVRQGEAEEV